MKRTRTAGEMSCRITKDALNYAHKRGVPASQVIRRAEILQGSPLRSTLQELQDSRAWTDWATAVTVFSAITAELDSDPDWTREQVREAFDSRPDWIRWPSRMLSLVVSVRALYWFGAKIGGPQNFPAGIVELRKVSRTELIERFLPPVGAPYSPELFAGTHELIIQLPRLLGLPPATVERTRETGGDRFRILLPPEPGVSRKLVRAVKSVMFLPAALLETSRHLKHLRQSLARLRESRLELRRARLELEERVRERTASLEKAMHEAESANRAKRDFIGHMSHEIRTPINAILGYAELLPDAGTLNSEQRRHLEIMERNGHRLIELIDDLLDVSRAESNRLDIKADVVDISAELTDVVALLEADARRRGLDLRLSLPDGVPDFVRTDAKRLRQILLNLVGNALKFTRAGEVSVEAAWEKNRLKLLVRDSGPGIHPEDREQLFQPFSQLRRSAGRDTAGTGLGLHLSRSLARSLGGDLTLEWSEPGRGSLFRMEIRAPAAGAETRPGGEPREVTPGLRAPLQGRVLIVEDHEENQILFRRMLMGAGVEVSVASCGREAIDSCLDRSPDLVFMDMQLPDIDGRDVTRRLRNYGYRGRIVALTAYASEDDRRRCLNAGCDDFLTKPINRERLVYGLRRNLRLTSVAQPASETPGFPIPADRPTS